jgi:hypothetical protein
LSKFKKYFIGVEINFKILNNLFDSEMLNLKMYTDNEKSCDGVRWVEGKGGFFPQVEFGVDSGLSMRSVFLGYLFCQGREGVKAKSTQWHLTFIPYALANVVLLSPINQNRTFHFGESRKLIFDQARRGFHHCWSAMNFLT